MRTDTTDTRKFHVKPISYLDEVRQCGRCERHFPGVAFARTRHGKYCQRCADEMDAKEQLALAISGFRKRIRLTPLKETAVGPWRAK